MRLFDAWLNLRVSPDGRLVNMSDDLAVGGALGFVSDGEVDPETATGPVTVGPRHEKDPRTAVHPRPQTLPES